MEFTKESLQKNRLKKSFFEEDTPIVAKKLLGCLLVRKINKTYLVAKIVETESYRIDDPASHCYIGKTDRNSALFGPIGHAYVYIIYGIHHGFNIVARSNKYQAGGVLIRAVEPLAEIEIMQYNRNLRDITQLTNLTNGPAKFTQAFNITKKENHENLLISDDLFISLDFKVHDFTIVSSKRVGISKAQDVLWRFYIKYNPFVSKK